MLKSRKIQPFITQRDTLTVTGILFLLVIFFSRFLFSNPTALIYPTSDLGTDLPREIWPLSYFMTQTYDQTGEFPLWRSYSLSGAPIIGHPVAPVLYPPNWLVTILPISLALNILVILHLWWLAVGTYIFLHKHLRYGWEASLVGTVAFTLAPKWIAHISGGHIPMLEAISWWPWAFLAFSRYWATRKWHWALLLGAALAGQALNYLSYLAMSLLWLGITTLGYLKLDRIWDWLRRSAVLWGISLAVMFCLSAGQLLPGLELLPYTNRASLTLSSATLNSLPFAMILNILLPPQLNYPEIFIFPGVGLLLFSILNFQYRLRPTEKRWAVGVIVGLVLSFGTNTPVYSWLFRLVPGFSLLRIPTRWWIFSLFGLAILATAGIDKWLTHKEQTTKRLRIVYIGVGLLYLLLSISSIFVNMNLIFKILPSAALAVVLVFLTMRKASAWSYSGVFILVLLDIFLIGQNMIRPATVDEMVASSSILGEIGSQNTNSYRYLDPYGGVEAAGTVWYGFNSAGGYDSIQLQHYTDFMRAASGCHFQGYSVAAPDTAANPLAVEACPEFQPNLSMLSLANIRYIILPSDMNFQDGEVIANTNGSTAYDIGEPLQRFFGVSQVEQVSSKECLSSLGSADLREQAFIESPVQNQSTNSSSNLRIISQRAETNSVQLEVRTVGSAFLVHSETWAPGWKATIDGQPAELLRADCTFQGVWVPSGEHAVSFRYSPSGFYIGRWLSLGTVFLMLAFLSIQFIMDKFQRK